MFLKKAIFQVLSFFALVTSIVSFPNAINVKAEEKTVVKEDGFNIYIPKVENDGDSILITYNDKSILIDAGPADSNGDELFALLNEHVGIKNATLDYVIITHQDKDHIEQFCKANKAIPRWIDQGNEIDVLIDFDTTKDKNPEIDSIEKTNLITLLFDNKKGYSDKCKSYQTLRDQYIKDGKIKHYLTASQCTYTGKDINKVKEIVKKNNPKSTDIDFYVKNTFDVSDDLQLKILDNPFYTKKISGASSKVFNGMSVCALLTLKGKDKFLFTGDLVEYNSKSKSDENDDTEPRIPSGGHLDGETDLVKNNYQDLKDGVLFYKGAHHGSKYSNCSYLLDTIRPQHIAICASSKNHFFPNELSLLNMTKWTDKIYIPTYYPHEVVNDGKVNRETMMELNGDIHLKYDETREDKLYLVGDENYSIFSSQIMEYERMFNITTTILEPPSIAHNPINATYIKAGHFDILIGMGYRNNALISNEQYDNIINKIKYLCNDKVIDYLIIPTNVQDYYGFLIEDKGKGIKGLFKEKDLTIKNVISHSEFSKNSIIFESEFEEYKRNNSNCNFYDSNQLDGKKLGFSGLSTYDFYLKVLKQKSNVFKDETELLNSLAIHIHFKEFNYLNIGSKINYGFENDENELIDENPEIKKRINLFELPFSGTVNDSNFISKIKTFLNLISFDLIVITNAPVDDSNSLQFEGADRFQIILSSLGIPFYTCNGIIEGTTKAYNDSSSNQSRDICAEIYIGTSLDGRNITTVEELNKYKNKKRLRINIRCNSYDGSQLFPVLQFKEYTATLMSQVHDSNKAAPFI